MVVIKRIYNKVIKNTKNILEYNIQLLTKVLKNVTKNQLCFKQLIKKQKQSY